MNPSVSESVNSVGQDSFKWWFGIVENNLDKPDPALSRVKVRIFGYHSEDRKILPTEKLPWSVVLQPTTSASVNGDGGSGNGLKAGSMVVGFFADGNDAQQPIVIGSLFAKLQEEGAVPDSFADFENPGSIFMVQNGDTKEQSQTQPVQGIATETQTAPKEVAAKTEQGPNQGNPMAQNGGVPIANGVAGPEKTMFAQIQMCLENLFGNFNNAEVYEYSAKLTGEVTPEQNYIPIDNTSSFPPKGIVVIGGERIAYKKKNKQSLLDIQRGVYGTTVSTHKKGTSVKHEDSANAGKLISKVSGKVINFKKDMNRCFDIIKNLVSWLVNSIKSYLLGLISKVLNTIVSAIKSAIPLTVRLIAEAILRVMNQIGCTFDTSLIDSIMNNIKSAVSSTLDNLLSQFLSSVTNFIDQIQSCVSMVFDSIMAITSLIGGVVKLIESISKIIPGAAAASGAASAASAVSSGALNVTSINGIADIVVFLLNLLGIGCNRTPEQPNVTNWTDYNGASEGCDNKIPATVYAPSTFSCADFSITQILGGLWAPLQSYNTVMNYGGGMFSERDTTPGHERSVDHHTAGSYTEYLKDGSKKTVVNGDEYQLVCDNKNVNIKGTCYITIEGNHHVKVNGNYHLEVNGEMSLNVGKSSKFTYVGEHTSEYKNDSKLTAVNGLAISASKFGVATSGTVDIFSGAFTTFTNEVNDICLGSRSTLSLFKNNIIGLNNTDLVGGFCSRLIGGKKNTMVGLSNDEIVGLSYTQSSGAYMSLLTAGVLSGTTPLTINWQSGVGTSAFTSGFNLAETLGIKQSSVTGIKSEDIVGLVAKTTLAFGADFQPLKTIGP